MSIKYSLNRSYFILLLFLVFGMAKQTTAQISGGKIESKDKEKKKEKDESQDVFEADSLSGSVYYLTGLFQRTYRNFEDNSAYNVHAALESQIPAYAGGFTLGTFMPISPNLELDLGVTFFTNAEAYTYENELNDSTFEYKNKYMQIGIPIKLRYTIGNKWQFFGFAGVTPLNIINVRYLSSYTTSTGVEYEQDPIVDKQDFVSFNIMASAGVGVNYYFKNIGLTVYPEYRRHLFNTYANDTFRRDHRMYGLAINAGLLLRL